MSKALLLCFFYLATALAATPPASADAPPAAQAVLAVEHRWLAAIVAGDKPAIDAILSKDPEFVHVTVNGKLLYRADELAAVKKESFTMNPTEETVDFAGSVAIIHGINTVSESGKVVGRVRFTDVFVNRGGSWMAFSAQETAIR